MAVWGKYILVSCSMYSYAIIILMKYGLLKESIFMEVT